MKLEDILDFIRKDQDCIEKLDRMCIIHMYTKHYLLVAEELSEDSIAFLQPLKEHRDAYDHLMRVLYVPRNEKLNNSESSVSQESIELYIKDNIKKALGHEYRSFFDTADWLTYICRKEVREQLAFRGIKKRYEEKYGNKEYQEAQKLINSLPFKIAKYRESKDIDTDDKLSEIETYKKTLEDLIDLYKRIQELK